MLSTTQLIQNRGRLFWTLNILGWVGYATTAYIGAIAHSKPASYFSLIIAVSALGFLTTVPLRYLFRLLWTKPPVVLAITTVLSCYTVALGWRAFSNQLYIQWVSDEWQPDSLFDYFSGVMGSFYVLMCWSGLYFGIKYYRQLQKQTEQTLRANAAAHQAQLKMLRYQLNPHFLFNTLNAISTLILDRANETANQTVSRLSDFLRYTLDNDPKNQVSLRTELEALDLYLEIEKVRFGDRLTIHREIQSQALNMLVPSLILQPLIENAIKYAVTPREEGGVIRLCAKVLGEKLLISLADDGPGISGTNQSPKASGGVGLKNTRERLRQLYGEQQAFTLAPNDPQGLVATLNIPAQRAMND